jgi:hydroxypyruvate isomerase
MEMVRLSANLGLLWADRPLQEAIRAAAEAGFDAVELHWPYATDAGVLRAALAAAGLPVLGINTVRGDAAGDFGLAALPGRIGEARAAIAQAFGYAAAIGASAVHVMAGKASGAAARRVFVDNLRYASDLGAASGIGVLIEPLNTRDVPGYFLTDPAEAEAILAATGRENVRIMFDCYHMAMMGHDLLPAVARSLDRIGHIQFAAVPDRGEPDRGAVDYARLLPQIVAAGYRGCFGAEYRPRRGTDEGIGWVTALRSAWAAG